MLTVGQRDVRRGRVPLAAACLAALLSVSGCGLIAPSTVWVEEEQKSPSSSASRRADRATLAEFIGRGSLGAAQFAERLRDVTKGLRSGAPVTEGLPTGTALVPLFCWRSRPHEAAECTDLESALEAGSVDVRPSERSAAGLRVVELTNRGSLPVLVLAGDVVLGEFDPLMALQDTIVDSGTSSRIVVRVDFAGGAYPTGATGGSTNEGAENDDGLVSRNRRSPWSRQSRTAVEEELSAMTAAAFCQSRRVVGVAAWSTRGLRMVELFSSPGTFHGVTRRVIDGARERLEAVTDETVETVGSGPWRGYSVDAIDVLLEALRRTEVFESVPNGLLFSGAGFRGYLSLSSMGKLLHLRCEFD